MMRLTVFSVGMALLLVAGPAGANTFTLSSTIVITGGETGNPGVVGEIRPVSTDLSGTVLPVPQQDGTIDFANQDVIVFDIVISAGSVTLDSIALGAQPDPLVGNPVGAGAFDEAGEQPDSVAADGTTTLTAIYNFDLGGTSGGLNGGETSVRLFATYEASGGGMGALTAGSLVSFMISPGTNFSVQGTIVPEPATLALLAAGLAGLGISGRRRRAR